MSTTSVSRKELAAESNRFVARRIIVAAGKLHVHLTNTVLFLFACVQLWPFLGAFHQSADENYFQSLLLVELDGRQDLLGRIQRVAEQQGRIGIYFAMPLELLGAVLPEYAWGRFFAVACFGVLLVAFSYLISKRFGASLTRASILLGLCALPMAAHHLAPNAYPLLIILPILGLVAVHLRLAGTDTLVPLDKAATALLLVVLTLVLEYAFVAGIGLAGLAVLTEERGRRLRAALLHGLVLTTSLAIYLSYRAAFPSRYAGNTPAAQRAVDVLELQWLHASNGTIFPYLGWFSLTWMDLVLASGVFAAGTWLSLRLLPNLARNLQPLVAGSIALVCMGWAWLSTLPHSLTAKYQEWCQVAGDCTYVDTRIAALGFGAAAAVGIAALLQFVERHMSYGARGAALLCSFAVGLLGAVSCLHNRAAARDMAERELAFAVIRSASCRADGGFARDPAAMRTLSRTILWHPSAMEMLSAERYLVLYRDGLKRLGLVCQPIPFAPYAPVGFLGWAPREQTGRWSLSSGGMLLLHGQAGTTGIMLRMAAYVPPGGKSQQVTLRTEDGRSCSFSLGSLARDLLIPWSPGADGQKLAVLVETPDALSPSAVGASIDPRVLGVFLSDARPVWSGENVQGSLNLQRCAE